MSELMPEIDWRESIEKHFGFDTLRDGQQEVITRLVAGHSAVAIFPTGGGKSLCYQAPALLFPGITLVVSPLLALMKDQIDVLVDRGISAARLDSSLSADEYREVCDQARSGTLKLLYVAPERFANERFQQMLLGLDISLMAIDEAHCMSQWGHNFRPDYLKLSQYAKRFDVDRVLALTATATPQVASDICCRLGIDESGIVRTPFFRSNLSLRLTPVKSAAERDTTLLERLASRPRGATIVYVTLQKTAESVAMTLQSAGHEAQAYHAGMKDDQREQVQQWFMESDSRIVVATIAFGMGIDKSDIRYVYHFNPPKSLESYAQEIGRAGRDSDPSVCELFYLPQDRRVLENFAYGDTPTRRGLSKLLTMLFNNEESVEVSNYQLSAEFDIRALVLRTVLVYLELDGYIVSGTPIYTTNRFKPKLSSAEILAHFEGERREFLSRVLSTAKKGRTWLSIDLAQAASATESDRSRISRALNYLADQGWIELEASGVKVPYQIKTHPVSVDAVVESLWQRIIDRERDEIARVDQIEQLIVADRCQAKALSEHFGESIDSDCGQCSRCTAEAPAELAAVDTAQFNEELWEQALAIQQEHPDVLGIHRELARFLVGVTSPQTTRWKLTAHPLFGAFAEVPFAAILERAEPNPL